MTHPAMTRLERINRAIGIITGLFLMAMMLHVVCDVFARNLLAQTIPGTIEIVSMYYMPAIVFLPLAYAETLEAHIQVDLVFRLFPRRLREALVPITLFGLAVIYGAMAWGALEIALAKYRIGEYAMGYAEIVVWPGRFFVPVGFGALSLTIAAKAVICLVDGSARRSAASS